MNELQKTRHIIVARCNYDGIREQIMSYSLHAFGDASSKAYCTVIYLVMETDSSSYVHLLSSKTKVAPLVKHSTPRLELLSAHIVARLFVSIKKALASLISLYIYHFSAVIDFSSEKYSGSTGHTNSWY